MSSPLAHSIFTRARDLATEDEARQRFKTFLGSGSAYTASR
jgi:type IV secretion system protein TrbE